MLIFCGLIVKFWVQDSDSEDSANDRGRILKRTPSPRGRSPAMTEEERMEQKVYFHSFIFSVPIIFFNCLFM